MVSHTLTQYLSPSYWFTLVFNFFYVLVQRVIIWLFKPVSPRLIVCAYIASSHAIQPPPPSPEYPKNPKGRIAVIGAGLTGVSSAAHAIAHGFDVVIYEQDDKVGECISTHQGNVPCDLK